MVRETSGSSWSGWRRSSSAGGLLLVLLAAIALHLPTLRGYFLGDDFGYVRLYQTLPPRVLVSLFFDDWSQGIWGGQGRELRPLLALSYWADFRLWGANPLGFRLTNLLWLVLLLCGLHRLVASRERALSTHGAAIASVAALVFAAHPTLPGAVDWVAGRSDLLAATAVFWSLHFLARHLETGRATPAVLGTLTFAAGLFAKENAILVAFLAPGLLGLEAAAGRVAPRRWAAVLAPVGLVSLAWVAIRFRAFGPAGGPVGALRAGEARWGYYAEELLRLPRPVATTVAVIVLAAVLVAAWRTGRVAGASWLFWGALWPLAALAPAAAATYESPRHVLLAVAGPAVVLAKLAALVWDRAPRAQPVVVAAMAIVVAALGAQSARIVGLHADMGRASHELRRLLAAAPLAQDAQTVIVSMPHSDEAVFWALALPFAAGPPFLDRSLDVLSRADLYCCSDWVEASRPAFARLSGADRPPVYRIAWDERQRRFQTSVVASPFPLGAPPPATFDEGVEWITRLAAVPRGPGN
jgi:hypothetical protein